MNEKPKRQQGFTLIEIVLVLAIAGLLIIIVFLALSGAQRNRRDGQRRADLSRIAAQLEAFASNNAGCYPDAVGGGCTGSVTFASFVTVYLTGMNLNDPLAGAAYTYMGLAPPSSTQPAGVEYLIGAGNTCDSTPNTSPKVYTVRMSLEQGTYACRDNK